ncbi:MAG: hypothetical protein JO230_25045 [Xanthobacteraceae bacterium]|nr:hypothetical protein [Xanthobacteraceae bacterium]
MANSSQTNPAAPAPELDAKPVSSFPKQAIVVIHGIGEQMPMDTIKGFVHAVWETDREITANGLPNPAEVWSKPDARTGSLELRRITTRESIETPSFPDRVRSDFYELYWADLSGGSTWSQVEDWISGLLLRDPRTRVPPNLLSAWVLLWMVALVVIALAIATLLPTGGWIKVLLFIASAGLAYATHRFIVPYAGRVVRYTRAKPDNIAARQNIRERGLALLADLHKDEYDRIIIVGHSLGSILAYDLISYFWASRQASHTVAQGTPEFAALSDLERAGAALYNQPSGAAVANFLQAQQVLSHLLRVRPNPAGNASDTRWLITDLVTLGSPLTHAEFLLANSKEDLDARKTGREFPTSPPVRERLDDRLLKQAQAAGLPVDPNQPELSCFALGPNSRDWQLHHAAPYAVVRWTNIFDPARDIFRGDIISGPLAPVFGPGIVDIDLRALRGQSQSFTHTKYWDMENTTSVPPQVAELRKALNLAGQVRDL